MQPASPGLPVVVHHVPGIPVERHVVVKTESRHHSFLGHEVDPRRFLQPKFGYPTQAIDGRGEELVLDVETAIRLQKMIVFECDQRYELGLTDTHLRAT